MNIGTGNVQISGGSDIRQGVFRSDMPSKTEHSDFFLNKEERVALERKIGSIDLDPKEIFDLNEESPEEFMSRSLEAGNRQDTGAVIKYRGEVVAMVDYDGATTTRNNAGPIMGNGMSERIAALQSLYPGASVEIYPKGQGPDNAEAFEMFNDKKYTDYVEEQYRMMLNDFS